MYETCFLQIGVPALQNASAWQTTRRNTKEVPTRGGGGKIG